MILDVLEAALSRRQGGDQPGLLVHDGAAGTTTACIYIGSTRSESHIPGGHVLAVDAKTGKVLWHFNTIPQDEKDQGWDIAGPTWVGGERNGGGIWETPSIDPELGLLYVAVGNPFGDSTKRAGTNLFTDSIIALTLDTGHAEVVLPADAPRRLGLRLRQPADPVRHAGARPAREGARRGEQERLPLHPEPRNRASRCTRSRKCRCRPTIERAGRAAVADAADSVHGGGQADGAGVPGDPRSTFRPNASRRASSCRCSRRRGRNQIMRAGHRAAAPTTVRCPTARRPGCSTSTPSTSRSTRAGRREGLLLRVRSDDRRARCGRRSSKASGRPGSVVTASDLVFVGTGSNIAGYFFAFDAKTGELLWKFNTGAGVFSSPSDLHGERRAVRHRRLGRRRPRPPRRRSDSQLRAAAPIRNHKRRKIR